MKGIFFTFEGIDGSGKTTQIKKLASFLNILGLETIITREPGGTRIGDKIRDILLDNTNKGMSAKTEALLFLASRAELVGQVIKPAIENGKIIICDRFFDSTIVYQGIARNLGQKDMLDMSLWSTGGIVPDLTFLFSLNVDASENRLNKQKKKRDRMEHEENDFKQKIQSGYLKVAGNFKDRIIVIDAAADEDSIFKTVKENTLNILTSRGILKN